MINENKIDSHEIDVSNYISTDSRQNEIPERYRNLWSDSCCDYFNIGKCYVDSTGRCMFDSLGILLERLGFCLNVSKKEWNKIIKKYPDVEHEWYYFYDPEYFKVYKLGEKIPCNKAFLLEISINHGSGEYQNYVIKKQCDKFCTMQEFQGYLDSIQKKGDNYYFIYDFMIGLTYYEEPSYPLFLKVKGKYNGSAIVYSSYIGISNKKYKVKVSEHFRKGEPF